MNLYEKLATARKRFKELKIAKGGRNEFQKYSYFELTDILNAVTDINADLKLCTVENVSTETASLTVVDAEKPDDTCTFTVPMSEANLKGCHPVQSLGAVITYLRRYLYQNAYSVSEPEQIDSLDQRETERQMESERRLVDETKRLTRQANFVKAVKAVDKWRELLSGFGYSDPADVPDSDYKRIYLAMTEKNNG